MSGVIGWYIAHAGIFTGVVCTGNEVWMRHTSLFVLHGQCSWHSSHLSGVAGRQGGKMLYVQSLLSLSQQ